MAWSKIASFSAVACLALSGLTTAQDYPNKPVTVIVPFGPGGPGDVLLRAVTERLTQKWGKPAVVDYKPGAAGLLANKFVAKSAPDGYTLLQGSTAFIDHVSLA